MRELSSLGLAGNDAVLDLDHAAESRGERVFGFLLALAIRLWCLPFLMLAWMLTWTAIVVLRGTQLVAGMLPGGSKRAGGESEANPDR